ncbi:MAG: hypothetical protein H6584_02415 [Flavobacteriales bacterium]|nr:hypothetical protein [Flavobacteriales bacterium]
MKKAYFALFLGAISISVISCKPPVGGAPIPNCEFNDRHKVVFYNLGLVYPDGLSHYHKASVAIDNKERSLLNILNGKGDANFSSSKAYIITNIKADQKYCKGEKPEKHLPNARTVTTNTIDIPYPSGTVFTGEITVNISSDEYRNTSGVDPYYKVLWTTTGNNPQGGIPGNVMGKKIPLKNKSGRPSDGGEISSKLRLSLNEVIISGVKTKI